MLSLINRVDADLFSQLQIALGTMDPETFTVQRLEGLLVSVRSLNRQLYEQMATALTVELRGLGSAEISFQQVMFEDALPVHLDLAGVDVQQVYSAAMSRPMQGRLLSEWVQGIEADRMTRIRDSLRMGFVEGKTVPQMVREIRGTRAKGYSDGIIEIDRRHAEAVVRTAVTHVASVARDNFYQANSDLIKAVVWRSTLDSRTSPMCRVRDGLKYTLETHKPIGHSVPWLGGPGRLHWNCRSTSSPVLKSWKELGGEDLPEFTPAQRASMDGAVPAEMVYADWLARQSARRQDEILGPARGLLLRQGKATFNEFSNDKGQWLTLDQLKARQERAFERAGV